MLSKPVKVYVGLWTYCAKGRCSQMKKSLTPGNRILVLSLSAVHSCAVTRVTETTRECARNEKSRKVVKKSTLKFNMKLGVKRKFSERHLIIPVHYCSFSMVEIGAVACLPVTDVQFSIGYIISTCYLHK